MRLLCWLGFHKWEKWQTPYRFGYDHYQRRKCLVCGIIRERKVGWIPD